MVQDADWSRGAHENMVRRALGGPEGLEWGSDQPDLALIAGRAQLTSDLHTLSPSPSSV